MIEVDGNGQVCDDSSNYKVTVVFYGGKQQTVGPGFCANIGDIYQFHIGVK
ncbi:hypothetical protein ABH926_010343 [Catenulispora sp. GP43]|uniref:hypothetical protein n=1 Tax=Catenulispora sp. GP43 TaxID=3156263 RepID=UPI0035143B53